MTDIDTNISNYTYEELLTIIDVSDISDKKGIMNNTTHLINKFKHKNSPLHFFFQDIQNVLLNHDDEKETQEDDDDDTDFKEGFTSQMYFKKNNHLNEDKTNDQPILVKQEILNPNMKNTITRHIHLDSQFRPNMVGSDAGATKYTVNLSDTLKDTVSLVLYSFQIPFSWYVISADYGNNTFWIIDSISGNIIPIVIPDGNYTPVTFTSQLNKSFSTAGFTFNSYVVDGVDMSSNTPVIYNQTNGLINLFLYKGRFTDANPATSATTFNITEDTIILFFDFTGNLTPNDSCKSSINHFFNNTLGWIMGFKLPYVHVNIYGNQASSILDLNGPKYLVLSIDDFNQNHVNDGMVSISQYSNVLKNPSYYSSDIPFVCKRSNNTNTTDSNIITDAIAVSNNINTNPEIAVTLINPSSNVALTDASAAFVAVSALANSVRQRTIPVINAVASVNAYIGNIDASLNSLLSDVNQLISDSTAGINACYIAKRISNNAGGVNGFFDKLVSNFTAIINTARLLNIVAIRNNTTNTLSIFADASINAITLQNSLTNIVNDASACFVAANNANKATSDALLRFNDATNATVDTGVATDIAAINAANAAAVATAVAAVAAVDTNMAITAENFALFVDAIGADVLSGSDLIKTIVSMINTLVDTYNTTISDVIGVVNGDNNGNYFNIYLTDYNTSYLTPVINQSINVYNNGTSIVNRFTSVKQYANDGSANVLTAINQVSMQSISTAVAVTATSNAVTSTKTSSTDATNYFIAITNNKKKTISKQTNTGTVTSSDALSTQGVVSVKLTNLSKSVDTSLTTVKKVDNLTTLVNNVTNNNSDDGLLIAKKYKNSYTYSKIFLPSNNITLTLNQLYSLNAVQNNSDYLTNYLTKAPTTPDIIGIIPVKTSTGVPTGSLLVELSGSLQTIKRTYFGPVNINRLAVKLLDDKGRVLNLNGHDWCCTLVCECLYKY